MVQQIPGKFCCKRAQCWVKHWVVMVILKTQKHPRFLKENFHVILENDFRNCLSISRVAVPLQRRSCNCRLLFVSLRCLVPTMDWIAWRCDNKPFAAISRGFLRIFFFGWIQICEIRYFCLSFTSHINDDTVILRSQRRVTWALVIIYGRLCIASVVLSR